MPRRSYDLIEIMRTKSSWSREIVSKKDQEYAYYSGADLQTAFKLAQIDTMLKVGAIPKQLIPLVKLARTYFNQRRKAYFASTISELSQLGFILGLKDDRISAKRT